MKRSGQVLRCVREPEHIILHHLPDRFRAADMQARPAAARGSQHLTLSRLSATVCSTHHQLPPPPSPKFAGKPGSHGIFAEHVHRLHQHCEVSPGKPGEFWLLMVKGSNPN